MRTRKLGKAEVSEIGFGCMSLSHAYGDRPDRATAEAVLKGALGAPRSGPPVRRSKVGRPPEPF